MTIRITQSTTAAVMLQGIETSYDAFQAMSAQISSGLAITKPSDNPAGAVQVMSYNAEITRLGQYQTNANDGLAWLGSTDNVLSSVQSQLQRVQQLVLQGAIIVFRQNLVRARVHFQDHPVVAAEDKELPLVPGQI